MFAKIAKFRVASAQQLAPSSATPTHSNDNWIIAHAAPGPYRTPKLACHWRPKVGGRFECCWTIELADSPATEEPDPRWICIYGHALSTLPGELGRVNRFPLLRMQGTVGRRITAERFPVRAAG